MGTRGSLVLGVLLALSWSCPRSGYGEQLEESPGVKEENTTTDRAEMTTSETKSTAARAYLIHITHYDPYWYDHKDSEAPFDVDRACEVVDALGKAGFNTLIIDLGDGVEYRTLPELKRHYSVPMAALEKLVARARQEGLEVVPKLNFSKSREPRQNHNYWFRPYSELPDNDTYWAKAFQLIDEIIEVTKPEQHFFVGMDEDFQRTPTEYVSALKVLSEGLAEHGLHTVMWNDTASLSAGMFGCVEKTLAAEDSAPSDIVHVLWDYGPPEPRVAERVRDMRSKGLEVWIAPGRRPDDVEQWKQVALETGCSGMVMTVWQPVAERNLGRLLDDIGRLGPIYARADAMKAEPVPAAPGARANRVAQVTMGPTEAMDDPVIAPNRLGEPVTEAPYLLPAAAYVRNWMLLGPFRYEPGQNAGGEQQEVIDDDRFVGGVEASLIAAAPGAETAGVTWRRHVPPGESRFPQVVDLAGTYGEMEYALVYAVAHVYSERDVTGYSIYLGSDDYVKIWLNGQLIHTWAERTRGILQDDDKVEGIALRKGWNKVVVKCPNVRGGWGFILRIADEGDHPLVTE